MELNVTEKGKGLLKVEVSGESHTLLNLLREKSWKAGASQASYMVEHPYLSNPKIIVRSQDPKKTLSDAAQLVLNDVRDFQKEFSRSGKSSQA
jgi:DNA-directed RNA polymerase subunit L